jgi:hypothetical protein
MFALCGQGLNGYESFDANKPYSKKKMYCKTLKVMTSAIKG